MSVSRANVSSAGDPRAERDVELQPRGFAIERVQLGVGERPAADENRPDAVGRVGAGRLAGCMLRTMAMCRRGSVTPSRAQRLDGQRRRPVHLGRPIAEIPARDAQQAVVGQVLEKRRPRLDRVERVLAEHERAGRRRRPGVDERDLNRVEAIGRSRDEAARLVVDEAHARVAIEMAGEVAEAAVHGADDVLVDLDGGHRFGAEGERRQDVAAAAGADRRATSRLGPEVVADVGDVVLEVLDALEDRRRSRSSPSRRPTSMSICSWRTRAESGSVGLRPQPCGALEAAGSPVTRTREYEFHFS